MNRKKLTGILIGEACLLLALAGLALGLSCVAPPEEVFVPASTTAPTTAPTEPPMTAAETTLPPPTETDPPETTQPETTEPEPTVYTLTFAGDCTFGVTADVYGAESSFPQVVGGDFAYPFRNVQTWFATDDFTMVNLEGPLTDVGSPEEKLFAFRGDPEFAKILPAGSVEWVSLANNHSMDYGQAGYDSTCAALEEAGIAYAGDGETSLITTERGLTLGIFAAAFSVDTDYMAESILELRNDGAEIVIVSFHWGEEGVYRQGYGQELYAHAAIDAGADIVVGHHPHVLQPVEEYGGGVIFYSLGNFSFGGNSIPRDFDTAVIQQQVIREVDGTLRLGEQTRIPCSISSTSPLNNYQPTPLAPEDPAYSRVLQKLDGSYDGPDFPRPTETDSGESGE